MGYATQYNWLKLHTLLVVAAFATFFVFVLDVVRPVPPGDPHNYDGKNCLNHIVNDDENIRGDFAIWSATLSFMFVAALTLARLMGHGNARKEAGEPADYKVASIVHLWKDYKDHVGTKIINLFLLLCHVWSAVMIVALWQHVRHSSDNAPGINACSVPDHLPEEMSSAAMYLIIAAIAMEFALFFVNYRCEDCDETEVYSAKPLETIKDRVADFSLDSVRNVILVIVVGSLFSAYVYALNEDLTCRQNDVRHLLFSLIFAVEALVTCTTSPNGGRTQLACLISAFGTVALVSFTYNDLVANPVADACTLEKAGDEVKDNAKHLEESVCWAFWAMIAFVVVEVVGTMLMKYYYQYHDPTFGLTEEQVERKAARLARKQMMTGKEDSRTTRWNRWGVKTGLRPDETTIQFV